MKTRKLLTVTKAAEIRGVDKSTVTRWLVAGLRHQRLGAAVGIDPADLAAFTPRKVGNPNFGKQQTAKKSTG